MVDRPMLFSAPMVVALLEGRKTQTRRIIKLPTKGEYFRKDMGGWASTTSGGGGCFTIARDGSHIPAPEEIAIWNQTTGTCIVMPYQIGDNLWVRERFAFTNKERTEVGYIAESTARDYEIKDAGYKLRPSIHMPRVHSRLTLTVIEVRVQRLQDISEEDAQAEGMGDPYLGDGDPPWEEQATWIRRRQQFRNLWNSLHGPSAWQENPWIVALTFTVRKGNIDAVRCEPKEEKTLDE